MTFSMNRGVHEMLTELSPRLAGLHSMVFRLLSAPPNPGEELARASTIGHCMRELMNRFPDVLRDVAGVMPRRKVSSSRRALALGDEVRRHPDLTSTPGEYAAIPTAVLKMMLEVIELAEQESRRNAENHAVAVAQALRTTSPAVKEWKRSFDFFMRFTHVDAYVQSESAGGAHIPPDAEILRHVALVERLIEVRLSDFFASSREIEDALQRFNHPNDQGEFLDPTVEDVREMLLNLGRLQHRRIFYAGLNNPRWVGALTRAGAFREVPEPTEDANGFIREDPWPEIDYLTRMSGHVPGDVVAAVLALPGTRNSWIRRGICEIVATVPATKAGLLVPIVESWAPLIGYRSDARHLVRATENLLRDPATMKVGKRLAALILEPRDPNEESDFRDIGAAVPDFLYEESLRRIVPLLRPWPLASVLRWLEQYADLAYGDQASSHLRFARPRIGVRRRERDDVQEALIDVVRDESIASFAREPAKTAALLKKSSYPLAWRMLLHSAAQQFAVTAEKTDNVLAQTSLALMAEPAFMTVDSLPESAELARGVGLTLGEEFLMFLGTALDAGPLGDVAALRERMADRVPAEQLEVELEDVVDRWKHRFLAAVGSDALPPPLAAQLRQLDLRLGEALSPYDTLSESTERLPPPLDCNAMTSLETAALIAHLASWRPSADRWRGPSHRDQADVLREATRAQPLLLADHAEDILRLRPTYVSAVLRGWEESLRASGDLPWSDVLTVVDRVLGSSDEYAGKTDGDAFEDEPSWRGTKRQAVTLITEVATPRKSRVISTGVVERAAAILIDQLDFDRMHQEYSTRTGGDSDPLTLSLNEPLPEAIRALTLLASCGALGEEGSPVLALLDALLPLHDPRGAIAAVFGERTAGLYVHARGWMKSRSPLIFGSATDISFEQKIALTTALATLNPHPELLDLFREPLALALRDGLDMPTGWDGNRSPYQLIGDWIVHLAILGHIDRSDPLLGTFFSEVDPAVRGDVLGHLAWTFLDQKVEAEYLDRAATLFDERLAHVRRHREDAAELREFYWFVRCRAYPAVWWLPRLREAAELSQLDTRGMIGEQLADAARQYPELAFDILQTLLHSGVDADGFSKYDLVTDALPTVLASALSTDDGELKARARRLMSEYGEKGFIELERQVDEILRGL